MRLRRAKTSEKADDEPTTIGGPRSPESTWFWDHYEWAVDQIVQFLDGSGFSPEGRDIADLGCGDGILTLGLARRIRAQSIVGFDVNPVDLGHLTRQTLNEGVSPELPPELEFCVSEHERLPAEPDSFDFVSTWSAFEHIANPGAMLSEVRRVLRPQGLLYLQLWPFYFSERGSHLWEWFPESFHHLLSPEPTILEELRNSDVKPRDWTEMMAREFRQLNRLTLDELQRCILGAGLSVVKLELLTNAVFVPRELVRYPLSDLGVTGVKLLAIPS
jgi:ubiquinone/menaquinone biosynthesis C-methylase UbiE